MNECLIDLFILVYTALFMICVIIKYVKNCIIYHFVCTARRMSIVKYWVLYIILYEFKTKFDRCN